MTFTRIYIYIYACIIDAFSHSYRHLSPKALVDMGCNCHSADYPHGQNMFSYLSIPHSCHLYPLLGVFEYQQTHGHMNPLSVRYPGKGGTMTWDVLPHTIYASAHMYPTHAFPLPGVYPLFDVGNGRYPVLLVYVSWQLHLPV